MINYKADEFTFGKYKGENIDDVDDVNYLKWVLDELSSECDNKEHQLFAENVENRIIELEG